MDVRLRLDLRRRLHPLLGVLWHAVLGCDLLCVEDGARVEYRLRNCRMHVLIHIGTGLLHRNLLQELLVLN